MTESAYFFDDNQQLIKIVGEDKLISVVQEKSLPENDLMNDRLIVTISFDEELENAEFIAVREDEKVFSLYKTVTIKDPENHLEFDCVGFAPNELDSYIVKDIRPQGESLQSVAERLLEFTDKEWHVGHVDKPLPAVSGSFYYISVKESLKKLQEIGCEILFFCTITGEGITDKWIEIYEKIGEESNERFDYGSNVLSVIKEQSRGQIYTSLIGRGKGEEVGDGYGRRLEFTDVEWKKSNGDAVNKPRGQNFVEIPEMTEKYGIPRKNGKKRKRENVVIFEDIEDAKELLKNTYKTLVEVSRPLVQFSTDVLEGDSLGNIVTVHRNDRNYHYKTRVFGIKIDRLSGKVTASLGDRVATSMPKKMANTQNGISQLQSSKMNFYDSTEISKWQSDIIRGAKGGSIMLMNPEDTGKGKSRQPYQQVFMNGDSIETSDEFLVMNAKGVGFIKGDFNETDFKTAWTIDGNFNADYIQSGKIKADIFETSFNAVGDQLKLVGGALQAWNKNKKIMELTKRGNEFWTPQGKKLGVIGTTESSGNPFPGSTQNPPYEDHTIVIKGENEGDWIALSTKDGNGITIGQTSINMITDKIIITPRNGLTIGGDVNVIGDLQIKGQSVTPGGSGGGNPGDWDGEYPEVVKTQAEKFAWQAWSVLRGLGYNENASAGILGNINGEAGPSMNPDTDQVGGPAYGAIQFDGSAYPLVGAPTSNGREYVQRLLTKSGIKGDYKEMETQMKLVNWAMTNGQWIGKVNPTSVSGFKNVSSPETGAYAFEENFERPADAHPERQGYARNWYNKFHGVPLNNSNGYAMPIKKPITVTSEFGWRTSPIDGSQELHNGIDLVNGNPTTPIYAADSGEVVIAGSYPDWYGNYVVIKHSGGLYTGYAHQSQLRVSVGDTVKKGQQIGNMGTTGPSTGNHLHFQFFKNGPWPSTSDFINPREKMKF